MTDRAQGHYWVRFGSSPHWDVMFWRDGLFWDHEDFGRSPEHYEVGPRVYSPAEPPDPAAADLIRRADAIAAMRLTCNFLAACGYVSFAARVRMLIGVLDAIPSAHAPSAGPGKTEPHS